MRAYEFIRNYTLDDIYEITDNMKPMFVESLNSKFSSIKWSQDGSIFTGIGVFNNHLNQIFMITITIFPYKFENKIYKTAYIEFNRVINGNTTYELLDLDINDKNYIDPAIVFGSIFNSIITKIKELNSKYNIDNIAFTVEKNEVKRLSLYRRMLSRAHGNDTWKIIHTFDDDKYSGLLVSKHTFDDNKLEKLKSQLQQYTGKS